MKTSEIVELTTRELKERIEEERSLLTRMRLNHAISPLESPIKIRHTRKLVARLETEWRKRQLTGKL